MYGIDLFSPINSYCVCMMTQWYGVLSVIPLLLLMLYGVTMQLFAARRAASVVRTFCTVLRAYMSITSSCCLVCTVCGGAGLGAVVQSHSIWGLLLLVVVMCRGSVCCRLHSNVVALTSIAMSQSC